jgi:hypothetical protein
MNNNTIKNNRFLIIILIIIAILLFMNIFLYVRKRFYESFVNSENEPLNVMNNINLGINIQSGTSTINPTGTIIFSKPYSTPPLVFAQIIGNTSSTNNIYSIQIFDITNTSFNYSKNKAYISVQSSENSSSTAYLIPKIDQSNTEQFVWIAFG